MNNWTNKLKLTLEDTGVLPGLRAITGGLTKIGTEGVAAVGKLKSALGGVGDILFKLPDQIRAVQGILSSLSLPSKLAGSAETTSVAFRVLIGNAEKSEEVLGRLRALAADTPFEFPELADAARKLAAFGEAADDIPETLRRVGDIASATGSGISELSELYGKARVQGTLFAEDINQLTGRGIPIIQEFARILGVSTSEVKDLASQGQIAFPLLEQAFRNMTDSGGQFSGMMGELSKTFDTKVGALGESFNALLSAMGEGINKGLKPVLDELTETLSGQQSAASEIGDKIGYGIEVGLKAIKNNQLSEILSAAFDVAVNRFKDGLSNVMKWLGDNIVDLAKDIANPVALAERINKRVFEHMITPVGLTPKYDAVSEDTRNAEDRLKKALEKPMGEVDADRAKRGQEETENADAREEAARAKQEQEDYQKSPAYRAQHKLGEFAPETDAEREAREKAQAQEAIDESYQIRGEIPPSQYKAYEEQYGTLPPEALKAAPAAPASPPPASTAVPSEPSISYGGGPAPAPSAPERARRRIQGAVSPRNGQGVSVQGASGLGRTAAQASATPARAERMAGMGNAAQRQERMEQRSGEIVLKATELFLKRFPDLVDAARETARKVK